MVGTSDQDHGESKAVLELWRTTVMDFHSLNLNVMTFALQGLFLLTGAVRLKILAKTIKWKGNLKLSLMHTTFL